MKKIFIVLFITVLPFAFYVQKTDAYEITWSGDWISLDGVWVDNETGYGTSDEVYGTSEDIDIQEDIGLSGFAYAEAWTYTEDAGGPYEIGSLSVAESLEDGELAGARSFAGLYNTFTLTDSGGWQIPYWLDISLEGYIEGELGGSYNELAGFSGIWIEEVGTLPVIGSLDDVDDLVFGDNGGLEPVWNSSGYMEEYDGDELIEEMEELLRYANEDQEYEILSLLGTYAYTNGDAFRPYCL